MFKEFMLNIEQADKNFYVCWFVGSEKHIAKVDTWQAASEFCARARNRKVGAFGSGIMPSDGKRKVFCASYFGPLAKYENKDGVRLSIDGLIHDEFVWPEMEAKRKQEIAKSLRRLPVTQKEVSSESKPDWLNKLLKVFPELASSAHYESNTWVVDDNPIAFVDGKYEYYVTESDEAYPRIIDGRQTDKWETCYRFTISDLDGDWENYEDFEQWIEVR